MGTIVIDFDAKHPEALYVLTRARELIENEDNWVQGPHAVDLDGDPVDAEDPKACAWCAFGALEAVDEATGVSYLNALELLRKEALRRGYPYIWHLNDDYETDHEDVLAAFDAAIEAAMGEGGDE